MCSALVCLPHVLQQELQSNGERQSPREEIFSRQFWEHILGVGKKPPDPPPPLCARDVVENRKTVKQEGTQTPPPGASGHRWAQSAHCAAF